MILDGLFWIVLFAAAATYWLVPERLRLGFLASASFAYLLSEDPRSLAVLAGWSLLFYRLAPRCRGRERAARFMLAALVLSILGYLAYFKYVPPLLAAFATNPLDEALLLPLGISYFTFKLIHYAVEVARGRIEPHSLSAFLAYVFLFSIFTAGPIERFEDFLRNRDRAPSRVAVAEGLTRIVHGLIKKFVIVELLLLPALGAPSTSELLADLSAHSAADVWLHVAYLYAYVYLDFSAYSDIAIGASRLFGFRIVENFDFPFLAPNITNFWNRWHRSLSGWCRAYVYMPAIGWTRNPTLAVYATMAAIGLWHAGSLNWLCWGLYHATGIVAYGYVTRWRRRARRPAGRGVAARGLGIAITLVFVSGSFVFPATADAGGLWGAVRLFAKLVGVSLAPLRY